MKIYVMRHGETALNVKGVMQGWIDEPLNENGRELAVISGKNMKGIHFDHCFSSPLDRAMETAKIILRESGNGDVEITEERRIMEINFGDVEGKEFSVMGEEGKKFFLDPFNFKGYPNGENVNDVCKRTQEFLKELIAVNDDKTYLVSTHGCAMRAMTGYLKDDPANYWGDNVPYNCSFVVIDVVDGVAKITEMDKVFYDKNLIVDRYTPGE